MITVCRNFIDKAGAFAAAVKYKVFIVCPDTSPRGIDIEGDSESWDFGKGAGFYVNAAEPKWKTNYRCYLANYATEIKYRPSVSRITANLPSQDVNQVRRK
jgi:S-formylglutathione hydrolase FrmB